MEPVSILAISTSPRRNGNTETMLDRSVAAAESFGARVEKVVLSDFNVGPCREIYACEKNGECVIKDDFDIFYRKFMAVDRLVMAMPVFFFSVPAQAKALVDRCQCFWVRKYKMEKTIPDRGNIRRRGYLLSAGGYSKPHTFDGVRKVMKYFYMTLDMDFAGEVCVEAVDEKGDIDKHPDVLKAAWDLGMASATP